MKPILFRKKLLFWYHKKGRHSLPWQKNKTPYRVWISEIMLQQTQVDTVIPYFNRFMKRFSSIKRLATASLDDVMAHWSGLGYYSRARYLHTTSNIIHHQHHDKFPKTIFELEKLPGIGRSTAGAILSLSMDIPAPVLDGNVKRVFTRIHAIQTPINQTKTMNALWQIAEHYTPQKNAADYTQALMDFGATICTPKNPACIDCPFKKNCGAYLKNLTQHIPQKTAKKTLPIKKIFMLIMINSKKEILLEKRASTGLWGSLWCLPFGANQSKLLNQWEIKTKNFLKNIQKNPPFRHTFSHFHFDITPIIGTLKNAQQQVMEADSIRWYDAQHFLQVGIPKPVKQLLLDLKASGEIE